MSVTAEKLCGELASLSNADRAAIAHFLLQSLDQGSDEGADDAWDAELARRGVEIETGRAVAEPAEKVFAELRAKHG